MPQEVPNNIDQAVGLLSQSTKQPERDLPPCLARLPTQTPKAPKVQQALPAHPTDEDLDSHLPFDGTPADTDLAIQHRLQAS